MKINVKNPIHVGGGVMVWYDHPNRNQITLHREDGPAVIHPNGNKDWYYAGTLHRTDGPALERADGNHQYYINGVNITEWLPEIGFTLPLDDDQMIQFKLRFG